MKKYYYLFSMLLIGCILLSGCGKINENEQNTTSVSTNNTETPVLETPVPKEANLNCKEAYSDTGRTISILGFKEYKKLKANKYTDTARKGKKYLVLFLEIYNKGTDKDYFNVNYLSAKIDGTLIENTFLLNEPEGYPTIFTNIEGGNSKKGFIVWEVPQNWRKLEICYTGWKGSDGLTLKTKLTRTDLKEPEIYTSN